MSLLSGGAFAAGQYPAKFSFDITATPDCTNDFVVYNTGILGSSSAANIVAFNQLYSTQGSAGGLCDQDGPSVYWSYYLGGGGGRTRTSVALSLDGSKVAFVEDGGFGTGVLNILKWKAGEGSGIASPAAVDQDISGSSWTACTAGNSCIATVSFSGTSQDSSSAPYVDYANDVIYVGDNIGSLHKFTGVFNGTPAEVTTGWPIVVDSTKALTSPVFDSASGNIFVGDSAGRLSYVRDTSSTVGTCASGSPPCLGATTQQVGTAGAIVDGPLIDSTSGFVFAVNGSETLNHGTILQANTSLTSPVAFSIGGTGAGSALYNGAFDQTYLNSTPGNVSGFMYVCGKDPASTNKPAVYQLSFTSSGVLNSVGTPPAHEFDRERRCLLSNYRGQQHGFFTRRGEWIFFSIGGAAAAASPVPTNSNCRKTVDATNGNKGCLFGINLTNAANSAFNPGGTWPPIDTFFTMQGFNNNANAVALPTSVTGASSGIIVDNVSADSQASNLYFRIPTSSGTGPGLPSCNTTSGVTCAVKLTQSSLN